MLELLVSFLLNEVAGELKSRFGPPLSDWKVLATLQIGDVTSVSGHAEQDVVVALVDWDHVRSKEDIVEGGYEEEGLLDLMESVCDITRSFEFSNTFVTGHLRSEGWHVSASPKASTFLSEALLFWMLL